MQRIDVLAAQLEISKLKGNKKRENKTDCCVVCSYQNERMKTLYEQFGVDFQNITGS